MIELNRRDVLHYRMHRHGLPRTDPRAAILELGVQHSGASVDQALAARGLRRPDDVTLAWSYRGAPHLHRNADLAAVAAALLPSSEDDARARLSWSGPQVRRCGMPATQAIATVTEVLREVVTAPMSKGAVSAAVTKRIPRGLGYECRGCRAFHVYDQLLRVAALPAGVRLEAVARGTIVAPIPGFTPPTSADPRCAVRAYLRFLGPATQREVADFLAADDADVRRWWPANLVECTVDGRTTWLAEPPEFPPEQVPVVRLLPPFDPYLQARDRALLVPDATAHKRLWRILSNPGALLVDGEILGTWRAKAPKHALEVTVEAFTELPEPVRAEIETEAEMLAGLRGKTAVALAIH